MDIVSLSLLKGYINKKIVDGEVAKGDPGKSAYEVAIDTGTFSGTEEEWLASIETTRDLKPLTEAEVLQIIRKS